MKHGGHRGASTKGGGRVTPVAAKADVQRPITVGKSICVKPTRGK